jgi:hypothetical protein
MTFIEPLALETWFIQVFAGTADIFMILALMAIASMAAFFRMNGIGAFFMVVTFLLMFAEFFTAPLLVFAAVIGGLMIGYTISRIFNQ